MNGQSPYCYPGTKVLVNKADIRDQAELQVYERQVTAVRLSELQLAPLHGHFDLEHLKQIHRHIFQDVYSWAGELRTVDLWKQKTQFLPGAILERSTKRLFDALKGEHHLRGLGVQDFTERAAHYMAGVNLAHPFREGNGRSQREFLRNLALNAGYEIQWSRVGKRELLLASIIGLDDQRPLAWALDVAIVNREPSRTLQRWWDGLARGLER